MGNYVTQSIETHLFFARIMKEHALFLEAGFPCKEKEMIQRADTLRKEFEELLRQVVQISNGRIGREILKSQELVTDYTLPAEKRTSQLTGIPINSRITEAERELRAGGGKGESTESVRVVNQLNQSALRLLDELIALKEDILREVENGRLFTTNYPLLIQHILRETRLYRSIIAELYEKKRMSYQRLQEQEKFWNQIMMEHALFIRGLLDPTEVELIESADHFAAEYRELLELANAQNCRAMDEVTRRSLEETLKYRQFKTAGTEGILECEIASIILPLLADHVLREANHYIRILETGTEENDHRQSGYGQSDRVQGGCRQSGRMQSGCRQDSHVQNNRVQSSRRQGSRGQGSRGQGSRGQGSRGQDSRGQGSRGQDSRGQDNCSSCSEAAMKGGQVR